MQAQRWWSSVAAWRVAALGPGICPLLESAVLCLCRAGIERAATVPPLSYQRRRLPSIPVMCRSSMCRTAAATMVYQMPAGLCVSSWSRMDCREGCVLPLNGRAAQGEGDGALCSPSCLAGPASPTSTATRAAHLKGRRGTYLLAPRLHTCILPLQSNSSTQVPCVMHPCLVHLSLPACRQRHSTGITGGRQQSQDVQQLLARHRVGCGPGVVRVCVVAPARAAPADHAHVQQVQGAGWRKDGGVPHPVVAQVPEPPQRLPAATAARQACLALRWVWTRRCSCVCGGVRLGAAATRERSIQLQACSSSPDPKPPQNHPRSETTARAAKPQHAQHAPGCLRGHLPDPRGQRGEEELDAGELHVGTWIVGWRVCRRWRARGKLVAALGCDATRCCCPSGRANARQSRHVMAPHAPCASARPTSARTAPGQPCTGLCSTSICRDTKPLQQKVAEINKGSEAGAGSSGGLLRQPQRVAWGGGVGCV